MTTTTGFAAEATAADIETLETVELVEWLADQTWSDFAQSLASYWAKKGFLTEKQKAAAKKMRATCQAKAAVKAAAKAEAPTFNKVTEPGIYTDADSNLYKVQQAKTSGKLYAKAHNAADNSWEYVGAKVIYNGTITADDKLTAAKAAEFGKTYGSCVNCSKLLTDDRSVEVGYGPVCAANNGWPWG